MEERIVYFSCYPENTPLGYKWRQVERPLPTVKDVALDPKLRCFGAVVTKEQAQALEDKYWPHGGMIGIISPDKGDYNARKLEILVERVA